MGAQAGNQFRLTGNTEEQRHKGIHISKRIGIARTPLDEHICNTLPAGGYHRKPRSIGINESARYPLGEEPGTA